MDQLATYSSDSDANDEYIVEDDQAICPQDTKPDDKHSAICQDGQTKHSAGSSGINFFGFTGAGDLSQESTKEYEDSEEMGQSRLVSIHGDYVEVPEGDFWKHFSETEIPPDDLKNDLIKPMKRKSEAPIWNHQYVGEVPLPGHSMSKRHRQYGKSALTDHDKTDASSSVHLNHKPGSNTRSLIQNNPSVKVFSVHPKISPHLNRPKDNWCASRESHRWAGHAGVINRIAWCSAPSFSHLILSASMDSTMRVWNAWGQHQPCLRTLTTHTKAVRDAQWSADGKQVLSCSYDRTAAITDVETGHSSVQFEHSGFVSAGKFHPVSHHLITTGTTDCIQVWDIRQHGVPVRILTHKEKLGQIQDLMFSDDGQELFSCGDVVTRESSDRTILAWDFRTGVILSNQIFQERYSVTRLCLHPSQSQFLAQTQAGYIAVFSSQRPYKMNKNKRLEGHKGTGYNVGLSPSQDGSLVYSGSSDGKLYCYSFNTGKRIRTLNCGGVLLDVAAHPVLPSVVAGATWDGDIVLFQ